MGNITETSYFEELKQSIRNAYEEHEAKMEEANKRKMSFVDEVTVKSYETDNMTCNYSGLPSVSSYETEVNLDRDIPFDPDEVDVITDHLDEVSAVEQLEADAELYYEGLGHA